MNSGSVKETFGIGKDNKKHSKYKLYISKNELFKYPFSDNNKQITANDVFISSQGFNMFSSVFSNEDDKLPQYMVPYRDIIANVTNFSEEEMDRINKMMEPTVTGFEDPVEVPEGYTKPSLIQCAASLSALFTGSYPCPPCYHPEGCSFYEEINENNRKRQMEDKMEETFEGFQETTKGSGGKSCSKTECNNALEEFDNHEKCVIHRSGSSRSSLSYAIQMEKESLQEEKDKIEAQKLAEKVALEIQIKSSLDKKVDMIMQRHKFFVKRMCPVKIPYKSTLNHQEHEFYLRSFIKFQIRPYKTKHEEEEYNHYVRLQNKLFNEQSSLMNFSYKVSQLVINEYNTVPHTVENYMRSYVNHRCKRISSYPQYFRTEMNIPIKPQDQGCSFKLNHLGHLLSLGSVPVMKIPCPYVRNVLPMDESVEEKRRPDGDAIFDQNKFLYKCPVSKDPNAEFLAQEHNVNIVMSASAFKTIVDNQEQPFDKYWNIPGAIKSYKIKDEQGKEKSLRVVYIDKPLPKVTWHPLEAKACFLKQSALAHLTHTSSHPNHIMKAPVLSSGSQECRIVNKSIYEDDIFETASDNVSDFFESSFSTPWSPIKSSSPFKNRKLSPKHSYYNSATSSTSKEVSKGDLEEDLFLTDDDEDDSLHSPKFHDNRSPQRKNLDKNDAASKYSLHENKTREFVKPHFLEKSTHNHAAGSSQNPSFIKTDENSKTEVSESSGLLDNLLNMQKSFLTLKSENHLNYKQVSSSVPSSLIQFEDKDSNSKGNFHKQTLKPWSQTMHTDWRQCKNLKKCPYNKDCATNYHYQLYQFENVRSSPAKEASDTLKIIIRHKIHGLSLAPKFVKRKKFQFQNKRPTKAYIVYPKLENQIYFGAEVNSYSEIAQQWASLAIRPNTTLLQVRVCVSSGSIVLTDERTLETVLKEGNQSHIKFDPQTPLGTLNALFRCLTRLSSGQYMIHHSLKTEAFISIMKETDGDVSQSNIDTQSIYANGSMVIHQYKVSPWLNIDTHVLTPFHLVHKKVPGTFPMDNPHQKLSKQLRKKKRLAANKKKNIDDDVDSKSEQQQQPKKREREERQEKQENKSKRRYF